MRPSFTVSLLLLLSLLLLTEQVQGIRLEKGSYKSVRQHKSTHVEEVTLSKTNNINGVTEEAVVCRDGKFCSGTEKKRVSSKVSKKSHHWLPSIHEDYYGPRRHRSRHH